MISRWFTLGGGLVLASLIHLWLNQLQIGPINELIELIWRSDNAHDQAFELIVFTQVSLPRLVMALVIGATLGCIGSLFQQLTQNRMMSPLTLGTSSGAWLGLILLNVTAPTWVGELSLFFAMFGALAAMGLVLAIVGLDNLNGLPVILAGMAINLLLGAVATAIILLNNQYAENLFIWGAGDLGQNGWEQVIWLVPKLSPLLLIFIFAPRLLTILSIGSEGAAARGLNVASTFFVLLSMGVWLVSVSITSVGVISFVGLIAPNIARYFGFFKARYELLSASLVGAILLCTTDTLATFLGQWSADMIPTGTATAVIGAPALILIARRQIRAQDQLFFSLPKGAEFISRLTFPLLSLLAVVLICLMLFVDLSLDVGYFTVPDNFEWNLRYPRILTAISAGAGLSVAGVVLQRCVYNPLASPDILGVSAGAVLALIASSLVMGYSIHATSPWVALLGSGIALGVLLMLGRKHQFAPSMVILTGISLTAVLDAFVQFALSRVGEGKYVLLGWLSGSTYRVESSAAITLMMVVFSCSSLAILLHRWITLIATGRSFALARGLNVSLAYTMLLILVAVLCASVTTTMGPVAFVGLLAPHIAVMLGAKQVKHQLTMSVFIGAALMLFADLLGQTLVYPAQLSAGTLVSIIGGMYFIYLLLKARATN